MSSDNVVNDEKSISIISREYNNVLNELSRLKKENDELRQQILMYKQLVCKKDELIVRKKIR